LIFIKHTVSLTASLCDSIIGLWLIPMQTNT